MIHSTPRLILYLLAILIISACSEASTNVDPNTDDEQNETTVEPTVRMSNISENATLKGIVNFDIHGEAESGIDEVRIYLNENLIQSIDSPNLPLEESLATYEYNNGNYDLSVELDAAGQDTIVSTSVSVTFENYFLSLESDGYLEALRRDFNQVMMFLSDDEGEVIHVLELTMHDDGTLQFLPPEKFTGNAPETYNLTIARKVVNPDGREMVYLSTEVGLPSWSTIFKTESETPDSQAEPAIREVGVHMYNFAQTPLYTDFYTMDYRNIRQQHHDRDLQLTIPITEGYDDFVITHTPDFNTIENPVPVYRWEKNLTQIDSSLSYDVIADFNPMTVHDVSIPSSINMQSYSYFMTIDPNSFDDGDMYFGSFWIGDIGDANASSASLGMWVPEVSERSFITYMDAVNKNDPNVRYRYQSAIGDFPSQFTPLNADIDILNHSLDDLRLSVTGSFDYAAIYAVNSTDNYFHRWSVSLPDDADTFVFPKISTYMQQVSPNYKRYRFQFSNIQIIDTEIYNGYADFLGELYMSKDFGESIEWKTIIKSLNTSNKRKNSTYSVGEKERRKGGLPPVEVPISEI